MRDASLIAVDVCCDGCGRPLVKDGYLKCQRCEQLVEATLGRKRIFCPYCKKPRILLARHDQALCQDRRCSNYKQKIGTPMVPRERKEMVQEAVNLEKLVITKRKAVEGVTRYVKATLRSMKYRGDAILFWQKAWEFREALESKFGGFNLHMFLCYTNLPVESTQSSFLRVPYSVYFGFPWWDAFYPSLKIEAPGYSVRLTLPEEDKYRKWDYESLSKRIEELFAQEDNYLILADLIVRALSKAVGVFDEVLLDKVLSNIQSLGDAKKEEYWINVRERKIATSPRRPM